MRKKATQKQRKTQFKTRNLKTPRFCAKSNYVTRHQSKANTGFYNFCQVSYLALPVYENNRKVETINSKLNLQN